MLSSFAAGAATLLQAVPLLLRNPRMMMWGLVPPLITSVIYAIVGVGLVTALPSLVDRLLGEATGGLGQALHLLVMVAIAAGAVMLGTLFFTALTLAIGAPVYERIGLTTERLLFEADPTRHEPETFTEAPFLRGIGQSVALLGRSLLAALVIFLVGLIPAVGAIAGPVCGLLYGGWTMASEQLGPAFQRRGALSLADRGRELRRQPARVLGLGIPSFLVLSVPLVAILAFPVVTVAATIMGRQLAGPGSPRFSRTS